MRLPDAPSAGSSTTSDATPDPTASAGSQHRSRATRSLILPAVLVGSLAAVALPGAVAAPASTGTTASDTAATSGSLLPAGWASVDGVADTEDAMLPAGDDDHAPKRTTLGVVLTVPSVPVAEQPVAAVEVPTAGPPPDPPSVADQAAPTLSGSSGVRDGATGIPATVLAAYKKAEANLAAAEPACHLPWWVLAGIGHTESDHAYGGRVDANGTTRGRILGIVLDGSMPGTAVVLDTDGGKWDGDSTYDRAVGPMQFLPGSWRHWGKDGNGDGVADPNNVFDAATAAGYLLCAAGDLSSPATLTAAILSYNDSAAYVQTVLTWGAAYRDGATPSPDAPGAVPPAPATPVLTPPPAPAPSPTSVPTSPPAPSPTSRTTAPPPRSSTTSTTTSSTTSTTTGTTAGTTSSSTTTAPSGQPSSSSTTTAPTTTTTTGAGASAPTGG